MKMKRQQLGVSLIEVLVSVTILVLGLVGLAALQARSLMMNQSAYYRSIAADLAANLGERVRANRSPFLASSDSELQPALPPDFSTSACPTPTTGTTFSCTTPSGHESYLAAAELGEWYAALKSQLPGATYTLTQAAAASSGRYRYSLTITWLDNRSKDAADTESNTSYSVVIE